MPHCPRPLPWTLPNTQRTWPVRNMVRDSDVLRLNNLLDLAGNRGPQPTCTNQHKQPGCKQVPSKQQWSALMQHTTQLHSSAPAACCSRLVPCLYRPSHVYAAG